MVIRAGTPYVDCEICGREIRLADAVPTRVNTGRKMPVRILGYAQPPHRRYHGCPRVEKRIFLPKVDRFDRTCTDCNWEALKSNAAR